MTNIFIFLCGLASVIKENDMEFVLFPDLYEDWKSITFAKELLEDAVKEIKKANAKGE